MSDQAYIKSLVREAEIYRSQGLLTESRDRYQRLLGFIAEHRRLRHHRRLRDKVVHRLRNLEQNIALVGQASGTPERPEELRILIGGLFSSQGRRNTHANRDVGAKAGCAQRSRDLNDFRKLIDEGILPLMAARKIISHHLALSSPDAAIAEFETWVSNCALPKNDLKSLRRFLRAALEKQGIRADLPRMGDGEEQGESRPTEEEDENFEISKASIQMERGPRKGEIVDFEVKLQRENRIGVVVPRGRKDLLEGLDIGIRLTEIQFYSPMAVFKGSGTVTGRQGMEKGLREGGWIAEILIEAG
jgi:hypothetical protein